MLRISSSKDSESSACQKRMLKYDNRRWQKKTKKVRNKNIKQMINFIDCFNYITLFSNKLYSQSTSCIFDPKWKAMLHYEAKYTYWTSSQKFTNFIPEVKESIMEDGHRPAFQEIATQQNRIYMLQ